jgi:hypothetical protein
MASTVLWAIQQASMEMGLPKPNDAVANLDLTIQQLVALLNAAGTEMTLGYPWQQLNKTLTITTVAGQDSYALPADFNYFLFQTQWDRTNHWPLMGPKSAQEWEWLKGGLLSSAPRIRYRINAGQFQIHPVPAVGAATLTLAMEYVSNAWLVNGSNPALTYDAIHADDDILLLDPWLCVKFLKLKFWEAKGLATDAYTKDFVLSWEARTSKNKGGPILSMARRPQSILIGIENIPDGSWATGGP